MPYKFVFILFNEIVLISFNIFTYNLKENIFYIIYKKGIFL